MDDWRAFVAGRDAGAGALWLVAALIGLIVRALPERWRAWAVGGFAVYAVIAVGVTLWQP